MPFYSDIAVHEPALIDQGFDTEATGAAPSGWSVAAGTGAGVSVAQVSDRAGKCVRLHDESSGQATMSRGFASQSRAVTVRWDFKETVAGNWARALATGGPATVVDIVTRQDAGGRQLVYRTPSGTWEVVQPIADDTWYSVRVIVDPAPPAGATPWVDIFVDGVRRVFHAPLLGSPAALDKLHFQTNPALATDLYVDNVSVVVTESVNCDGTSQEVMDQEIRFASAAGIDYWAIDYYSNPELRQARDQRADARLRPGRQGPGRAA
ncbi:hypothetical protein ACWEKM_13435 [Streptomyces sp. NPDC004752]